MTRLSLYKFDGKRIVGVKHIIVPRCPMFDFANENNTPEAAALIADGYTIGGHTDGIGPELPPTGEKS